MQAVTGNAGWPMTVWLRPDLTPIAGGTYYPPRETFGRPGFPSMLLHISKKVPVSFLDNNRWGWMANVCLANSQVRSRVRRDIFPPERRARTTRF